MKQPMQPIFIDEHGTARFKPNKIVRFLLDWATNKGMSLNDLAIMPIEDEDRSQLAQLIGYSVSGYGELSYHQSDIDEADRIAEKLIEVYRKDKENRINENRGKDQAAQKLPKAD